MFSLFKSAPFPDEQLGALERRAGYWTGSIALPPVGTFKVKVWGDRRSPDAAALELARRLPAEFPALINPLQDELFAHYEPYWDGRSGDLPRIEHPSQVWLHVSPAHVLIEPLSHAPTIVIAMNVAWDEDHTVGAFIEQWKLTVFSGSV